MSAERRSRRYVDTRTRYQGIFARHRLDCALAVGRARCTCTPTYYGTVWDKAIGRNRRTERRPEIAEARNQRADLLAKVRRGLVAERPKEIGFQQAHEDFIAACREGVALNKQGNPYKRKAIVNLDSSLRKLPKWLRRKKLGAVTRGDFQAVVDDFRKAGLSSSRIGSVVNASRSLYRWAEARELVADSPIVEIRLPANDSVERDRVATPGEFAHLLGRLEPPDALPYAIAGYGTARLQEIQVLEWPEVDFRSDVMLLAGDEDARKSEAARRIVPLVRPLRRRLYKEWVRQGRPETGKVCPPRKHSESGLLSLNQLSKRVSRRWEELQLRPIGLQDSRHTAATWLDHAGVAPKVGSVFMGHKAPRRQPDAAPITLRRYTHVLTGELGRARDLVDIFLVTREEEEQGTSFRVA